uniref:Uncharacterized protein n=1 Tax=Lactuca sativa TaxID=4236 RepID=A0A9R1UI74_LACSA|nr:hypothetical protein LSAT_V11C900466230 [Lactuca sativa]
MKWGYLKSQMWLWLSQLLDIRIVEIEVKWRIKSQTVFSRSFRFVDIESIGSEEIGDELCREPDSRGSCFTGLLIIRFGFCRIRIDPIVSEEFSFAVTEGKTFGVSSSGECRSFTA